MSLELLLAVVILCYFLFYTDSFALLSLCFSFQINPLTFAISSSSHLYCYPCTHFFLSITLFSCISQVLLRFQMFVWICVNVDWDYKYQLKLIILKYHDLGCLKEFLVWWIYFSVHLFVFLFWWGWERLHPGAEWLHICAPWYSSRHKVLLIGKVTVQTSGCVRSRCAWPTECVLTDVRCQRQRDPCPWKNSRPSKHLDYGTTVITVDSKHFVSWDFKSASHAPASFLAPKHRFRCNQPPFQPRQ